MPTFHSIITWLTINWSGISATIAFIITLAKTLQVHKDVVTTKEITKENADHIQRVEASVNGRLKLLLEATSQAQFALGSIEGAERERLLKLTESIKNISDAKKIIEVATIKAKELLEEARKKAELNLNQVNSAQLDD